MQMGFEINTDIALVDPDWEIFADYHSRRYGLAIDYMKSIVEGRTFSNDVIDLVVGQEGFYTQSRRFPAAFYGDFSPAEIVEISSEEAHEICWEATALYRAGEAQSLTMIHSPNHPADVFFGYSFDEVERYEFGRLSTGLPLHLRAMIKASNEHNILGHRHGTLVYQRLSDGRHMLIKATGERQPFPLLQGLVE